MKTLLTKKEILDMLDNLKQEHEIIAPVEKEGLVRFEIVDDVKDIKWDYINSIYSIKKFFLPFKELLFTYTKDSISYSPDEKKRIIFGVRPCDVHSLLVMDKLMLGDEFEDSYYREKRENSIIIPVKCNKAGENCFCQSVNTDSLDKDYDLLLFEDDDCFIGVTGTSKGEEILRIVPGIEETDKEPVDKLECLKSLSAESLGKLKSEFENEIWKVEADTCLSCAACTTTCPSCGCFDVLDDPNLDLESGRRIRLEASCQLKNYSEVAGGHVFRDTREKRFKHRIFHKFVYFKDQHGLNMCIGCGRCITNCPADIDMVKIINKL